MSRYRKIATRLWADGTFRRLTRPGPNAQTLFLWLLAGPATCAIPGVVAGLGAAGMAERLGWPVEAFSQALDEVIREGLVIADLDAPLVFVPGAIGDNLPQSPNVVLSWRETWAELPACPLKAQIRQTLKAFLQSSGEAFRQAFAKACPDSSVKPLAIQEQEQEQEQEESCASPKSAVAPAPPPIILLPLNTGAEHPVIQAEVDEWARLYPAVDVLAELRGMRGWLLANPARRKTRRGVLRFANAWLAREQDRGAVIRVDLAKSQGVSPAPSEAAPCDPLPADLTGQDEAERLWVAIRAKSETEINRHSYETWLKPCRGLGLVGRRLFVRVPTPEFRIVGEKYGTKLRTIAAEMGLMDVQFLYREAVQ